MAKADLNNYKEWFEFVIGGETTRILEPILWSSIEIGLNRNEQYYGFDVEVLGENATLMFDYVNNISNCDPVPGGNLIIDEYNTDGQDAQILFRFGYVNESDVDVLVYEADLDLNIYNLNRKTVKVGARRISFDDLIRSRFETSIDITASEDLDGNVIVPKVPIDVELHSKGLFLVSEREIVHATQPTCTGTREKFGSGLLENRIEGTIISPGFANDVDREITFYAQPSLSNIIVEDLAGNQNIPDGISEVSINPQWILEDSGELTVDLRLVWSAGLHVSEQWIGSALTRAKLKIDGCTRGDARMGNAVISLKLKIGATVHTLHTISDNNAGCDLVYLFTDHFFEGCTVGGIKNTITSSNFNPDSSNFNNTDIDQLDTDSGGFPPVLNHAPVVTTFNVTQNVTAGDEVALYVEIFGEGTYNENSILASNLGWISSAVFYENKDEDLLGDNSFMNMSIKSFEAASPARSCLIFESGEALTHIITGESGRFRSSILGRTDTTPSYPSDGCASLNIITSGFQIRQFEEDERPITTTLEDYISSIQAIYNVGMSLEEDGGDDVIRVEEVEYFFNNQEMIELVSPFGYKETVAKEMIYNNIKIGYNNFLDEGINLLDEFNTEHEYSTPIKKNKQDKTILSTYTAGGYTIEVQRREQFTSAPSNSVENDDTIFIINVVRDGGDFKSAQDEGFSSVTGVFSPTSSYNLKISPKRMLYRWARWLKGAYRYKNQATNFIRFAFGIQNKDLETVTALGCEQGGTVVETGNVQLDAFPDANAGIFSPEWVEFGHVLTWDQFETIRNKLRGEGGGSDDYGYISVLSPITGALIQVWPYELKYTISTQKCLFKALKKGY